MIRTSQSQTSSHRRTTGQRRRMITSRRLTRFLHSPIAVPYSGTNTRSSHSPPSEPEKSRSRPPPSWSLYSGRLYPFVRYSVLRSAPSCQLPGERHLRRMSRSICSTSSNDVMLSSIITSSVHTHNQETSPSSQLPRTFRDRSRGVAIQWVVC